MKVANGEQVTPGQRDHLNCEPVAKHLNHDHVREGMLDE